MKTLHLNLNRKWFDMTESGEKTEDYREITDYWIKRFVLDRETMHPCHKRKIIGNTSYFHKDCRNFFFFLGYHDTPSRDITVQLYLNSYGTLKSFDTTTISNGYSKNRPQFIVEFKGIEIREGRPEWGAELGKKYFVIKHGKKL